LVLTTALAPALPAESAGAAASRALKRLMRSALTLAE